MKKINIFCFGFGQVAKNFIKKLIVENIDINLTVTSREKSQKKIFENIKYDSLELSDNFFDKKILSKIEKTDHYLISIAPIKGLDIVIKNFQNNLQNCKPKWITYLSATSVYGNHNGEWVNEESKTEPTSSNGVERLEAEKLWIKLAVEKKLPIQIFRLSGIYSSKKNILARLKLGNEKIIKVKNHFFSRIHLDDIANILYKSLKNFKTQEIYNISDDKPASSEDLIIYGCKLLKIEKPQTVDVQSIESNMLRNFYKDSKKVDNKKMKFFFNYELKYPSYIEGLNFIKNNLV
jgi:nucleoside-diphosphate-sugar epimerase